MKGQINVEFIASLMVFLSVVGYVLFSFSTISTSYNFYGRRLLIGSKAFQLSSVLLGSPGVPANWADLSSAKRVGLQDERFNLTNLIKKEKALSFCQSYELLKEKLSTTDYFTIKILDKEDPSRLSVECEPPELVEAPVSATVKRVVAYLDGEEMRYAEVIVTVVEV